jgi:hypothetical protein
VGLCVYGLEGKWGYAFMGWKGSGAMRLCDFCICMIHLLREDKGNGKGHPRKGHEGPEG